MMKVNKEKKHKKDKKDTNHRLRESSSSRAGQDGARDQVVKSDKRTDEHIRNT